MSGRKSLTLDIVQKYGSVKRARGCFLYTEKRVRLTDLYQEGGRAILGWGGADGVFTVFKNVLDRGITGSFITDFSVDLSKGKSRLSRAVSELFASGRTVFVFLSKKDALKSALLISPENTNVYRPWNPVEINWQETDCIIFSPVLPWAGNVFILAVKDELAAEKKFDSSTDIPAPLCAAITRSVYALIKALQEREEKNWFLYDKVVAKYWTRKGPYLFPKVPEEKYEDFVGHCLDCELVISPDFNQPSIIPFGADTGVFRKLEKNPFAF